MKIYLDDIRTPTDKSWIVVRDYNSFIDKIEEIGLENIDIISLDHDLGASAMEEYYSNVEPNYELNYDNITEKTGYDCAKWLVGHFYDRNPQRFQLTNQKKRMNKIIFPTVYVHSANPIGAANMMGYINNFLKNESQPQTCQRIRIEHTIKKEY